MLPDVAIMVSGRVNQENFLQFLGAGARSVALSSSLIPSETVEAEGY